jgi:glycogen debranching enzyme
MNRAYQIANNNLHACFKGSGIIASVDHFSDFWARDVFYASWGLLETGEFEKTKSNLNLFIRYQKGNGQIPRRIDRFFVALNYVGIKIKRKSLKAKYKGAYVFPALDPNILFIITCHRYVQKKNDIIFLEENFDAIYDAVQWLKKYEKNYFLHEGIFANWADVIVKTGAVLYTNVLYAEALKKFSGICALLNKSKLAETYRQKHISLKEKINSNFWNGDYYIDWINGSKKYNYFSTDGNVLAILFEISNREQNEKIIKYIEKFKLDNIPMKTNHPAYPWWRVALRMYIIGTPGYQNNYASWLWLGCVYAVSLYKNGYKEKAELVYQKISSKIEEFGIVYEIYKPDGLPYMGWFWKSAASFAWSSGLYLWMSKILHYKEKS